MEDVNAILEELKAIGNERTKKLYLGNGAKEPLYGVTIKDLKPLVKRIKKDQELAETLYATSNYDAMYLAGILAEPDKMTEADFNRWIEKAYFYMISDFIVAVTLSETNIAQVVADKWIKSKEELKASAGWSCYAWLLGSRKDEEFSKDKLLNMIELVKKNIHASSEKIKFAMYNFLYALGVSYIPLHQEALKVAQEIGTVEVKRPLKPSQFVSAYDGIVEAVDKGRIGFKRKYVRC